MSSRLKNRGAGACLGILVWSTGAAVGQTYPPYPPPTGSAQPIYAPPAWTPPSSAPGTGSALSYNDAATLQTALAAARSGQSTQAQSYMGALADPLARKLVLWALADSAPGALVYGEGSAKDFPPGWPRFDRRQVAADNDARVAAGQAEFQAGWTALTRLNDPRSADAHFARLQTLGSSPLTQSRAFYWRGRAAEAMADPVAAQLFYAQAGRYQTTFYGQLAAARSGASVISLGRDPDISPQERADFEANEAVRAARLLSQIGAKDLFKTFVIALCDALPSAAQEALLVDFARQWGDQTLAMRVVRNAARRELILPERGYPLRTPPGSYGAPEAAFVLGIVRQESSFDPLAHSGAGARGMMQLMPATADVVARRAGLGGGDLYDPTYNMTVGSLFLGQLVSQFSGSYVMAAAAYNAGPGRPSQWSQTCGDPRSASTDPVNFIECIPFSETRDYVMRVLEATQVYRARLAGGSAPNTLAADLKRGAYGYGSFGPASGALPGR